jgi:hypothetical protein
VYLSQETHRATGFSVHLLLHDDIDEEDEGLYRSSNS